MYIYPQDRTAVLGAELPFRTLVCKFILLPLTAIRSNDILAKTWIIYRNSPFRNTESTWIISVSSSQRLRVSAKVALLESRFPTIVPGKIEPPRLYPAPNLPPPRSIGPAANESSTSLQKLDSIPS